MPKTRSRKPSAPTVARAARTVRTARTTPATPPRSPKDLAFTLVDALHRADNALTLAARADVRARIERRLAPGVIEQLEHDRAQLRTERDSGVVAATAQRSATSEARDAAGDAVAWLSSVRETARLSGASSAVKKSVGVGAHVSADDRAKLAATVRAAALALDVPGTRAALGLLPEDATDGHALVDALATVDTAATATRQSRKSGTVDRRAAQKSLEASLRALVSAGQKEYWRAAERETRDAFHALIAEHAPHAASAPDAPAGAAASAEGATKKS